jgi:tRNA 2-thiocytidine biosynthesis protein TtcA
MLADWELRYPGRSEVIFSAICDVAPSQLGDTALFDFAGLRATPPDPAAIRFCTL